MEILVLRELIVRMFDLPPSSTLLPYYPISITGGSDQVCSSSTFSVSYPNSTVTWSCTGPLRITSQSNTSCTVSSTGNGPAVLKATIKSGK